MVKETNNQRGHFKFRKNEGNKAFEKWKKQLYFSKYNFKFIGVIVDSCNLHLPKRQYTKIIHCD